jgi:hypothetical protein
MRLAGKVSRHEYRVHDAESYIVCYVRGKHHVLGGDGGGSNSR